MVSLEDHPLLFRALVSEDIVLQGALVIHQLSLQLSLFQGQARGQNHFTLYEASVEQKCKGIHTSVSLSFSKEK